MMGCFLGATSSVSSLGECALTRTTSNADEAELSCRWISYLIAFQIYLIRKMLPPNGVRRSLEALSDTLKAAYGEI